MVIMYVALSAAMKILIKKDGGGDKCYRYNDICDNLLHSTLSEHRGYLIESETDKPCEQCVVDSTEEHPCSTYLLPDSSQG